ncbi:hypothetical protein [Curtobacterium sp. MCSS17_016]|uniref:hypothetical protein n=1 Tax=Curtobacterium sp. MCSS17_016 TaxID=2175644 RepID=UPI000DA78850|nr:hypothetical protein [Curtobacterium sp. MCSS17_016]WIE81493.1 hypothetical protein DEJ19_019850 [Curtobacterium sp. MCSS17_016]
MSWISRHKLPVILTAITVILATVAVLIVTVVVRPKQQQEADYATATKRLASAQKTNQKAHDAFDVALERVTGLHDAMVELPDTPKALIPAATLSKITADVKDLSQAMSQQAPSAATDLPKGDVTYVVATKALERARHGVMENTDFTTRATDTVLNTIEGVHEDLKDAASGLGDHAQSVLVANQGATTAAQTAFAASSDVSTDGDAAAIIDALKAYVAAGKQVIAENKAHPVPVEEDEPKQQEPQPTESTPAAPAPAPAPSATPTPAPSQAPAPEKAPQPNPKPVDHTPHVVANGQYVKSCSAPTALFTQETGAGGSITIDEDEPYTYETYDTAAGFGVKVSACSAT